jgi:hypothetical protein
MRSLAVVTVQVAGNVARSAHAIGQALLVLHAAPQLLNKYCCLRRTFCYLWRVSAVTLLENGQGEFFRREPATPIQVDDLRLPKNASSADLEWHRPA